MNFIASMMAFFSIKPSTSRPLVPDFTEGSNVSNAGTNGKQQQKLAGGEYITISKATGATAGLVGKAFIEYVPYEDQGG